MSWHQDGWNSLANVDIHKTGLSVDRHYSIAGTSRGRSIQLEFDADEIVMAEIVRYKPIGVGYFELSILDFDAMRNEWAVWQGNATTQRLRPGTVNVSLTRVPIHSHVVTPASPTGKQVKLPELVATPDMLSRDTFLKCSDCDANVKLRNLLKHLRIIHRYSPDESKNMVSARLLGAKVSDA